MVESGKFDECVTKTMYDRIVKILSSNVFDIVIFLGGTNDIGYGIEINKICDTLKQIYEYIVSHDNGKCKLIAVSVPGRLNEIEDVRKLNINQFISNYCEQSDNDRVSYCDLYDCLYSMEDKEKRKMYDIDELHLSQRGYNKFASILFPTVMQFISKK